MNNIYIDCRMGVTGTKLFAALTELLENPNEFIYYFNKIGIKGIELQRIPEANGGVMGCNFEWHRVSASDDDPYADELDSKDVKNMPKVQIKATRRNIEDVKKFISDLSIKDNVKERAIKVYERIAEVSAKSNGKDPQSMILHRTGSRNIIASVVGVCMIIDIIKPEKIVTSMISVGDGFTVTPKGKMPIPIPEVRKLLGDIPYTQGREEGDLCSIEGAALISEITDEVGVMPEMRVIRSGAGFGYRKFKSGINGIRAYYGEIIDSIAQDTFIELSAEIYDIENDVMGMMCDRLKDEGVQSLYMQSIFGISGQEGCLLKCITGSDKADRIASILMEYSSISLVTRKTVNVYRKEK